MIRAIVTLVFFGLAASFVGSTPRPAPERPIPTASPVVGGGETAQGRIGAPTSAGAAPEEQSVLTERSLAYQPRAGLPVGVPFTAGPRNVRIQDLAPQPSQRAFGSQHIQILWHSALASSYGIGDGELGLPMACGGPLTATQLTVANRTLPCGTLVWIAFRGHAVLAMVTDRGPYCCGSPYSRSFDLGPAVARRVHFDGVGVIRWRKA